MGWEEEGLDSEEQMRVIKSIHACGVMFWRMVMRRRK